MIFQKVFEMIYSLFLFPMLDEVLEHALAGGVGVE